MPREMGFDFGLSNLDTCFKFKYRWLLKIPDVSANGIDALPPLKSSRPTLSFKEMEVQHLTETVYFPSKPEFKPFPLTLYDIKMTNHPVWEWVKLAYNAQTGGWFPSVSNKFLKPQARLELYDGCGATLETWVFENVYPQDINFGELDMADSAYLTCDLQLRFHRAYLETQGTASLSTGGSF